MMRGFGKTKEPPESRRKKVEATKTFDEPSPSIVYDPEDSPHACKDVYYDDALGVSGYKILGTKLDEGIEGTLNGGEYEYFQVCVSNHRQHYHSVEVLLRVLSGEVDMYLSSHLTRPRKERHTWNSAHVGSDRIVLGTDLWDWDQTSKFLFVGVRASLQHPKSTFVISSRVVPGNARQGPEYPVRLRGSHTAMVNWDLES